MDEIIFECYLRYRKEQQGSLWKKIKKEPMLIVIVIMMAVVVLAVCAVIIMSLYPILKKWTWIPAIAEIVAGLIIFILAEKYEVVKSPILRIKHISRCCEIKDWLFVNGCSNKKDINLLHKRLSDRINKMKNVNKDNRDRRDKWIQILVVPSILTIIPIAVANHTELSEVITIIILIYILFFCIYGLVYLCSFITQKLREQRLQKMEDFVDILQDIIDWCQIDGVRERL